MFAQPEVVGAALFSGFNSENVASSRGIYIPVAHQTKFSKRLQPLSAFALSISCPNSKLPAASPFPDLSLLSLPPSPPAVSPWFRRHQRSNYRTRSVPPAAAACLAKQRGPLARRLLTEHA